MKPADPTPADIAGACLLIQSAWTPDERMRRLRSDLRPQVRAADGRLVSVTAGDYGAHHEAHELLEAGEDQ